MELRFSFEIRENFRKEKVCNYLNFHSVCWSLACIHTLCTRSGAEASVHVLLGKSGF